MTARASTSLVTVKKQTKLLTATIRRRTDCVATAYADGASSTIPTLLSPHYLHMSIRPPNTPRATTANGVSTAGSTPSSLPTAQHNRRASGIAYIRPSSVLGRSKHEVDALKEAMSKNDPQQYGASSPLLQDSPSPSKGSTNAAGASGPTEEMRKRVMRRPSTVNLRASLARSTNTAVEGTFKVPVPRTPRTPAVFSHQPRPMTPTNPLARSTSSYRTVAPRVSTAALVVGDGVLLDVAGTKMEGVLRFLGSVEGKDGIWAGIELDNEFHGLGKNDGSVKG